MTKLFLAGLFFATPFIAEEKLPSVEISEEVSIEESEIEETEESIENAYLKAVIEELTAELDKYKGMIENVAIQNVIGSIGTFLATLLALLIKFKSFDGATLTLSDSKKILVDAKEEAKKLAEDMKTLTTELNKSNASIESLAELTNKSLKVINASLLRLTERVEQLEHKED